MAAKGFVLQTADIELAANDGAQQILIVLVEQVGTRSSGGLPVPRVVRVCRVYSSRRADLRWPTGTPGSGGWRLPAVHAKPADCRWFSAWRPIWFGVSRRDVLLRGSA